MKSHRLFTIIAFLTALLTGTQAQEYTQVSLAELNALTQSKDRSWVSIHDPSVVHTTGKTYYVIGSHRGWGISTDNLVNLRGLDNANLFGTINANGRVAVVGYADAFTVNQTKKVKALVNGAETEVDFGPFDAKAWGNGDQAGWNISGNMWAPDLVYNPNSGKWMMYMSINGDAWHSVIVLLTADRVTGPYIYQGPVHYSGFINTTTPEISWKKTDLEIAIGKQSTLPARYNKGNDWGTWWTNDIDPCVFFDEEGELWMTYGSWSGGIFILRLDKETGLRDYTYTYELKNDGQGRALSDPYFGKRIAGGYYSSGEGSYIQHIGDYYYLFMSYGGFAPDGGYEMRTFRSATPDGQYVDASNLDACYHNRYWLNYGPGAQTNGGMKLMGAYNGWGFMTVGECAQGHNSATQDNEGRNFVVYHTKFNNGTASHQVRVHQLFLNSDGWLCAAPFQFDGETVNDEINAHGCAYTNEEIAGTYDVLIHKYKMDHNNMEEVTPIQLTLSDNGRITGDLTGSWQMTDGTAYVKIVAGGVTYNGVIVPQQVDGTMYKAICFTATAKNGVSIWGWKMDPVSAIAYTNKNYTVPIRNNATVNKNLSFSGTGYYGAVIEWESSEPDIISNTGKYSPTDTNAPVTLTCRIRCGNYAYEREFNVTASRATEIAGDVNSGIMAYYDFNAKPTYNLYNDEQTAFYSKQGNQTSAPTLEEDPDRFGMVVHQYEGAAKANSYTRFPNPLAGQTDLEGFTISTWVKRANAEDLTGTLWAFTDKMGNLATVKEHLFLTANGFVGFESGEDNFSMNKPNDAGSNPTNFIAVGEWSLVTLTISKTDGIKLYVDGTSKAPKAFESTAGSGANATQSSKLFDYTHVIDFITSAGYLQLGVGSGYGSAEASFDDLLVYNRALDATDVRGLNQKLNRVNDFSPEGTGIEAVRPTTAGLAPATGTIFDLTGRRHETTSTLQRGIYIVGGKKVMVK